MKKQAIMIIAHNNIWTLERLIKMLDSEYFDIYIHIDKKSKINDLQYIKNIVKKSKIFVYKKINVRWADYSQIRCELFLLNEAKKNNNYSYYHLISGADMPLKNAKEIYDFFEKHNGKEFVHFNSSSFPIYKYNWLRYYWFFRKFSRKSKILYMLDYLSVKLQKILHVNRLKKNNLTFMTGANWFSITNKFCDYILMNENNLKKIYKHTRCSDEIFLQTLLYNSHFKDNLYYSNFDDNYIACMRCIDWKRGNPYVFRTADYYSLINSEYMFARKFDEKTDKNIIELIYENNK